MIDDTIKIEIINKKNKPKTSIVYDTYWKFAVERQEVFFKRLNKENPPWTSDIIIQLFKFTNVYRASDRVSQYLIRNIIYDKNYNNVDTFFRIILFKLFNKIETWELITRNVGEISYAGYNFDLYNEILQKSINNNQPIYSGAYIMASGKSAFGYERKHQNHLRLVEEMINSNIIYKLENSKSMQRVYDIFCSYPSIGEFLAYQYAIDINYSTLTDFSEMDFVKAGPGAKAGIQKCFSDMGDYSFEDIVCMMVDKQEDEFNRLNLQFKSLWGRKLQKIDCQNIFCEVDKYSRVAFPQISSHSNRTRIKQHFVANEKSIINYFFPPKWNINHLISNYE